MLHWLHGTHVFLVFRGHIGWRFIERCEHFRGHSMFLAFLAEAIFYIACVDLPRIFPLLDHGAELAVRLRILWRRDLVTDFGSSLRPVWVLLMHDRTDTCLSGVDIWQPAAIALCCCIETLLFNGCHRFQLVVTRISGDLSSLVIFEHGADFCRSLLLAFVFRREIHGYVNVP